MPPLPLPLPTVAPLPPPPIARRRQSFRHRRPIQGKIDAVDAATVNVDDGEELALGDCKVTCLLTPGHTNGHISYHVTPPGSEGEDGHVFTGDCMFIGGCGR